MSDLVHFDWLPIGIAAAVLFAFGSGAVIVGRRIGRAALQTRTRTKNILMWLSGIAMLLLLIPVLLYSAMAVQTVTYAYNSEGRYFDGSVVYHDDDPTIYIFLGLFWAFPCVAAAAIYAGIRRRGIQGSPTVIHNVRSQ